MIEAMRLEVVMRTIKSLVDGEIASQIQHQGDQMAVRVLSATAVEQGFDNIEDVLSVQLTLTNGHKMLLRDLVHLSTSQVKGNLRHYNFKRTITLESNIDKTAIDTVAANRLIQAYWPNIRSNYPNVDLDFSGELDDIEESMDATGPCFYLVLR